MTPYDYLADRISRSEASAIDRFWEQFEASAATLDAVFRGQSGQDLEVVSNTMSALGEVHSDLMWEFGAAPDGHRLSITAEFNDAMLVLARAVVRRAPDMSGWTFMDARPEQVSLEHFARNFEARFGSMPLISEAVFSPRKDGRIGIEVSGDGPDDVLKSHATALVSDLMGEWGERHWLGPVHVRPRKKGLLARFKAAPSLSPDEFRDRFRGAVRLSQEQAPSKPYSAGRTDGNEHHLWRANGMPPSHPRSDLLTMTACDARLVEAILSDGPFASATHSRFCEWFCLLRIARDDQDPSLFLEQRRELEEQLQHVLETAGVGGVACTGQGEFFSYLDLALTDIELGLALIEQSVEKMGLLPRSDLRFLDLGLRERRVGFSSAGSTNTH